MTVRTSPINPSVLSWGLAQDGRTLGEIAAALKIERAELVSWSVGESEPRVGQVSDLAGVLHRPRVFFFLPEAPAEGAIPDGFRHPPGGGARSVSSTVLLEARRAKRVQQAIASTVANDNRPEVPLASINESPVLAAEKVRSWLGLGEPTRWGDEYQALRWWRSILEASGVLVFELQLGKDAVRGFAGWDDRAPMIVVNSSSVTPAARIYTIGHELAHLLLREATACLEPTGGNLTINTRTERWCERFAADLVMPADAVRQLMEHEAVGDEAATIDTVKAMMARFRVSARAAALRLNDLGYAPDGLYAAVLSIFRTRKGSQGGKAFSPPRHRMRLRQYGTPVVTAVLDALPPNDAMSVLRMDVEDVRKLADEVPGVPAY